MKRGNGETGAKRTAVISTAILSEFVDLDLGDARREERLRKIVEAFAASPTSSFPELMRTAAELEAFYRFVNSDYVTFADLTAPHARATARRIAESTGPVVVAHDPTEFTFSYDEDLRDGCEKMSGKTQGFYGNVSLAICAGSTEPLGVLHAETWTKGELTFKNPGQKAAPKHKGHGCGRVDGCRWEKFIEQSECPVADASRLIHVIDREADGFALYAKLIAAPRRFVIRVCRDRLVGVEGASEEFVELSGAAETAKAVHTIDVPLSRRSRSKATKQHPARKTRTAKLTYAAMKITLRRGGDVDKSLPKTITLNVVCVREKNPPENEEPIEWLLATTEPISTPDEVIAVVGYYRLRWRIEEFFRALKTGCAFERRQLESKPALLNALAISLVVAWHVMVLRHASRARPGEPASIALPPLALFVLRATGRVPLRKNATVKEALYAVAALGGHIKNNGDPGLTTLSRGMEHLLERVVACVLMFQAIGGLAAK